MEDPVNEVLWIAEDNAKWLDDAAKHFESLAAQLAEEEKSKSQLLAAVYRERARTCGDMVEQMRQKLAAIDSAPSRLKKSEAD